MKKKVLLAVVLGLALVAAMVIKYTMSNRGENIPLEAIDQIELKEERVFLNGEEIPDSIFVTKTESGKEYSGTIPKISSQSVGASGKRKVTYAGLISLSNGEEGK